jgi:hypothetical protein
MNNPHAMINISFDNISLNDITNAHDLVVLLLGQSDLWLEQHVVPSNIPIQTIRNIIMARYNILSGSNIAPVVDREDNAAPHTAVCQ